MTNEHGSHVEGWDATASRYDRLTAPLERRVLGPSRPWVGERTHGRVLEIGVGTGANLDHLPDGVEYTGTDVSEAMLDRARIRVAALGLDATLHMADATALPFEDGSFDCVISTYVFCCVPDERAALAEALRVLTPGGSLLLANHVASPVAPVRWGQRLVDRVTVPRMGEHFSRTPLGTLRDLGAEVVEVEHSLLGVIERLHVRPPTGTASPPDPRGD